MVERERTIDRDRFLDFEGWPGRWEIVETADETDGERFKTRWELEESGELPPHTHPQATETYEVRSGELEVMVEGDWSTLHAGETDTIPPGTVHAFRNTGPVEVVNVHSPYGTRGSSGSSTHSRSSTGSTNRPRGSGRPS